MSSGEDTRKKRDNAQQEHEEEKPKKAKKVYGEAIRPSHGTGVSHRHHQQQHQLRNNKTSAGQRRNHPANQFGQTKDDDQPILTSATSIESNNPNVEVVVECPAGSETSSEKRPADSFVPASSSESSSSSSLNKKPKRKVWDLESALLYIVQVGSGSEKEYLTSNKDCWIQFRMAHAGDAAPIANWYRQQQEKVALDKAAEDDDKPEIVIRPSSPTPPVSEPNGEEEQPSTSSLLEHWLSEGLGDEDTCPSVYGLMAYVHCNELIAGSSNDDDRIDKVEDAKKHVGNDASDTGNTDDRKLTVPQSTPPVSRHSKLAAVVLLTIAWSSGERDLRIEWMAIDHSKRTPSTTSIAVQQKVWLRLASLSVMTACQLMAIDNDVLKEQTDAVNQLNATAEVVGSKRDGLRHPSPKRLLPSAE